MTIYFALAIGSTVVASLGAIKYVYSIVTSNTRPRLASWIAWTISWIVLFAIAMTHHSHIAAIFAVAGAIRSGAVVTVAWTAHRLTQTVSCMDIGCLGIACSCLTVLILFPDKPLWSAALAAGANLVAAWPTVSQAWHAPFTDSWYIYAANTIACVLTTTSIMTEGDLRFDTAAGPLVSFVGNCTIVSILLTRRKTSNPHIPSIAIKTIAKPAPLGTKEFPEPILITDIKPPLHFAG